ncbi:MAG: hypothetical protein IT567_02940 [Alphaproteobacteria bacterium]|nr:hypothetical protein [Alphaproteobacteria bacterium]
MNRFEEALRDIDAYLNVPPQVLQHSPMDPVIVAAACMHRVFKEHVERCRDSPATLVKALSTRNARRGFFSNRENNTVESPVSEFLRTVQELPTDALTVSGVVDKTLKFLKVQGIEGVDPAPLAQMIGEPALVHLDKFRHFAGPGFQDTALYMDFHTPLHGTVAHTLEGEVLTWSGRPPSALKEAILHTKERYHVGYAVTSHTLDPAVTISSQIWAMLEAVDRKGGYSSRAFPVSAGEFESRIDRIYAEQTKDAAARVASVVAAREEVAVPEMPATAATGTWQHRLKTATALASLLQGWLR